MKSMQKKLMVTIIFGIVFVALFTGFISLTNFTAIGKDQSSEMLKQELEIYVDRFDSLCLEVEHSVAAMCERLKEDMPPLDQFQSAEGLRYMEDAKLWGRTLFAFDQKLAAVYYRLDPEIMGPKAGFFLSKTAETDLIEENTPTDLSLYSADDAEHVAWFYAPKEAGKPIWVPAYMNLNNGILTISYVAPLYAQDGTFVGVVGADIDLKKLYEDASKIQVFDTGFVSLLSQTGELQYSAGEISLTKKERLAIVNGQRPVSSYIQQQQRVTLLSKQLVYGDFMLLSVADDELYINENRIIFSIVFATLFASLLMIMLLTSLLNSIFRSFTTDALTGFKNRNAYMDATTVIDRQIKFGHAAFSVLVFDINGLKHVNDVKGHSYGDRYIHAASEKLRGFFPNENIFRIGGDEFAIIVMGHSAASLSHMLDCFCREMQTQPFGLDIESSQVSLSPGLASFDPQTDLCYEDVLKRADQAMYTKKAQFYKNNPSFNRRKRRESD